jgi:hypothetical protein
MRKNRIIELIDLIADTIKKGHVPIFVCEGSSEKKLEQIDSSQYLKFANERFRDSDKRRLVIFGCSLSKQDTHIINALDKSGRTLAIALHIGEKGLNELDSVRQNYENKFTIATTRFFDSKTLFEAKAQPA